MLGNESEEAGQTLLPPCYVGRLRGPHAELLGRVVSGADPVHGLGEEPGESRNVGGTCKSDDHAEVSRAARPLGSGARSSDEVNSTTVFREPEPRLAQATIRKAA